MAQRFLHTPNVYINVLRHCGISPSGHLDITQICPTKKHRWNDWVHMTRAGVPFLVLQCGSMKFMISRVRESKYQTWEYLVQWPWGIPQEDQYSARVRLPSHVADLIRSYS